VTYFLTSVIVRKPFLCKYLLYSANDVRAGCFLIYIIRLSKLLIPLVSHLLDVNSCENIVN